MSQVELTPNITPSPMTQEEKPKKRKSSIPVKKVSLEAQKAPKRVGGKKGNRREPHSAVKKDPTKKPRRYRPGTVALREIRKFQKSTDHLIPKAPFMRLVKEVVQNNFKDEFRFQTNAIDALRAAAEAYIVGFLEDANLIAIHAKRVTIMNKDMKLALRIRTQAAGY